MKKSIALLAALAFVASFALAGCNSTPAPAAGGEKAKPAASGKINDNTKGTTLNTFEYSGEWNYWKGDGTDKYKNDDHYTKNPGAFYQVRFSGTAVKLYGKKASHHGTAKVSIDGGEAEVVNYMDAKQADYVLLWKKDGLAAGEHILKVEAVGDGVITGDCVEYSN